MKAKILFIGDDNDTQEIMINFLSKTGDYKFFKASDGKGGIRIFIIHSPHIIIIDFNTPGTRGEEIVRFIKKDAKTKTKVICLSSDPHLEKVAKAAGCDVFLVKPFHLLKLQEAVELLPKNWNFFTAR